MPNVTTLVVHIPTLVDPGYRWLCQLKAGQSVNLMGPFGRIHDMSPAARHLLLVASTENAPMTLPAAEQMLDRGGQVTLLVRDGRVDRSLLRLFPLSVEVQATSDVPEWESLILSNIEWADLMLIMESTLSPQRWADAIRRKRIVLDDDFAQIYMSSDLLCCTGSCMACVVQRTDGSLTRACVHGPVFPLASLVR